MEEDTYGYLLIAPVFVTLSVLAFYLLARTMFFSFHNDNLTGIDPVGEFVGLKNYVQLLNGNLNAILSDPFMDLQGPHTASEIGLHAVAEQFEDDYYDQDPN